MRTLSRRNFLKVSGTLASSVAVSTAIQGCATGSSTRSLSVASFQHGVASGDPGPDRLLIWTRATPDTGQETLTMNWQLSLDRDFKKLIRSGQVSCSAANDFTVKVDIQELAPGQHYYYRFLAKDQNSATGHGRTLPAGAIEQLKLAVFSCSNYPAGYFNVYQHAANRDDIDYALHLGDFIYEYQAGGYASGNAERIGRTLAEDNQGELLKLDDYRKRYALYRTDRGLQELTASVPMMSVWDDHEIANDAWHSGAENHSADEGNYLARKLAAIQAYYEWMPVRPPMGPQSQRIYRSFDFGNLFSLHMLDTRIIARDEPLRFEDFVDKTSGQLDQRAFTQALYNPQRSLLGTEQMTWLKGELDRSQAHWQILGQQVLMGKMWFPAESLASRDRSKAPQAIRQLAALKQKSLQGQPLTATEQARLDQKLPYNLDAWDGYPAERETLNRILRSKNGNVVALAGDTHNAWHSQLTDSQGQRVGVEFATPSVTSPGMEQYLSLETETARQLAQALPLLVDDLQYCNLNNRGHLQLTVTAERITADWHFVDNIESTTFSSINHHQHTIART